jgi:hypothetical protein
MKRRASGPWVSLLQNFDSHLLTSSTTHDYPTPHTPLSHPPTSPNYFAIHHDTADTSSWAKNLYVVMCGQTGIRADSKKKPRLSKKDKALAKKKEQLLLKQGQAYGGKGKGGGALAGAKPSPENETA